MKCEHDLSEMETACADGYCPICLSYRLRKPTGLVRVKECMESTDYLRFHGKHPEWCLCGGTGFIRTDLTAEEAVEAFTLLVKGEGWVNYYDNEPIGRVFELPDGSRIELKEKP